jgi:hypothetical protein
LQRPLEGERSTAEDSRAAQKAGQTITAEDEKIPVEASSIDPSELGPPEAG